MSAGPRKPHCTETPEYWEGLARDERSFAQDRTGTVESQLLHRKNAEEYTRKAVEIRAKLASPECGTLDDVREAMETAAGQLVRSTNNGCLDPRCFDSQCPKYKAVRRLRDASTKVAAVSVAVRELIEVAEWQPHAQDCSYNATPCSCGAMQHNDRLDAAKKAVREAMEALR